MGEERGIWAGQPGALTVLGELEGVRSLVEEVGGVLVLGAEESPARELLPRLLLEVVTASLVITHRLCSCSRRRRRRLDRSLFLLLLRGGRRLPARRVGRGNGGKRKGGMPLFASSCGSVDESGSGSGSGCGRADGSAANGHVLGLFWLGFG